jgi:FkbM family methyltransferase
MVRGMIAKMIQLPRRIGHGILRRFVRPQGHEVLMKLRGIIHVGANAGQERDDYARYGLNVIWIEPVPWVFKELENAVSRYPRQQALEYLVLDKDDELVVMHVSNNDGLSSSVMDFALHRDIWPSVHFTKDIQVQSKRLDTIIDRERIDLRNYDGLVLDTQGSELRVLNGADRVLRNVRMVKIEVADFEAYAGCPRPDEIRDFLGVYGLKEFKRTPFAEHSGGGRYYDITYVRD